MGIIRWIRRRISRRLPWPRTVDEAVDRILWTLPDEDRELVKNTPEKALIQFHHGWGTGIRNSFGLWAGNTELLKSCGSEDMHPDSASMVIIRAVWQRLHEP